MRGAGRREAVGVDVLIDVLMVLMSRVESSRVESSRVSHESLPSFMRCACLL